MELNSKEKFYLEQLRPVEEMYKNELSKEILKGMAIGGAVAAMIVMPGSAQGFK